MATTVLEYRRKILLTTSSAYGLLATAVPTAFFAHRHLTGQLSAAAALAAATLFLVVVGARDLGRRRGRLAATLLVTGPFSALILARRTRSWRPLLIIRPARMSRR